MKIKGLAVEKSDHRHCRLLCTGGKRPRNGWTSNHFNKIAASHGGPQRAQNCADLARVAGLQQGFTTGEMGFRGQFARQQS